MKTKLSSHYDTRHFQKQSALRFLHKLQGDQYIDAEIVMAAELLGWADPCLRPTPSQDAYYERIEQAEARLAEVTK